MRWLDSEPSPLLNPGVANWITQVQRDGPPDGAPDNDGEIAVDVVRGTSGRVTITYMVAPYERAVFVKSIDHT